MKKTRNLQLFATFLLLVFFVSPSSTWALTTFGKTNPQNQNQNSSPPPTPGALVEEETSFFFFLALLLHARRQYVFSNFQ